MIYDGVNQNKSTKPSIFRARSGEGKMYADHAPTRLE